MAFRIGGFMKHPRDHFFLYWFMLSLWSAEYLSFRLSPGNHTELDWAITVLFGFPLMFLTFIPVVFFLILLYSILGWWGD